MTEGAIGFAPVFREDSKILILGSFPSVKSRQMDFYYGNKQNRFWRTVCGFFQEEVPESIARKKEFLYRRKIALWDMVISCDIEGSSDASVQNAVVANLDEVLSKTKIEAILLNGSLAYQLYAKHYGHLSLPAYKMTSTSPANPRFSKEEWEKVLYEVYGIS